MDWFAHLVDTLVEQLHDHAAKIVTAAVLMAVGWFFGRRRAEAAWRKREFLDRLNVSLNSIEGGVLKIRTLSEKRCEDVFLNVSASDQVMAMARKTTLQDPLLPISKDDAWFFLNAVLNDLSEQFAAGYLRRDQGIAISVATYLVCLTCECAGNVRTRKVRAMVIRKELLLALPESPPQLVQSNHSTRWETLRILQAQYALNPWRFIEVELAS